MPPAWSRSYQTFFLGKQRFFPFFATKLGRCTVQTFFSYGTNSQAYQRKSENRKNESSVGLTPDMCVNCVKKTTVAKESK